MTPTSFEFTMTMPGDERLLGAVRLLAAQAAGYAQLRPDAAAELAIETERAADAAMTSTQVHDAPIELVFSGDNEAVTIRISCAAAATAARPQSAISDQGVSVEWTADGSRHICRIRQRLPV